MLFGDFSQVAEPIVRFGNERRPPQRICGFVEFEFQFQQSPFTLKRRRGVCFGGSKSFFYILCKRRSLNFFNQSFRRLASCRCCFRFHFAESLHFRFVIFDQCIRVRLMAHHLYLRCKLFVKKQHISCDCDNARFIHYFRRQAQSPSN